MKHSSDIKTPSPKVGIVFVLVVLVVVVTIFGSKMKFETTPIKDLQNVELVLERKTNADFKTGDQDQDGLADWLEEFYKTDSKNPDSDGDGTNDGEEIKQDRDPALAGPSDPLVTRKDLINTKANFDNFIEGTLTDKVSVELFSEYLLLKKQGVLKPEDETKLVDELSKKTVEQASLKPKYVLSDLNVVESTEETISIYGDRVAQVSLDMFYRMDTFKYLKDLAYFEQLAKEYRVYAEDLRTISVPTVTQEVHLELMNYSYNLSKVYDSFVNADSDPFSSLVIISQFQTIQTNDQQLYAVLADYFKNNGIIFDTDTTRNFWKNFEN
jgi:hypothetical protein